MRVPLAVTTFTVASSICLTMQTTAQRPTFTGRTDLVQVDVRVSDKSGRPVQGLKADDFTILESG